MPHPIPPDQHYRLPSNPAELRELFTDHAERMRRFDFNQKWGLPMDALITDSMVRASSILIQEAFHLVKTYPSERLLFVTLTFRTEHQAKEAAKAFNNLNRRFLGHFIAHWIKVVDVHENGRNHIHALAVATDDVLPGTDLDRVREFLNRVQEADGPQGRISWSERQDLLHATSRNIHLHTLWAALDCSLTQFGFGFVYDALPVIHPPAVCFYLRKALLRGRWHDARRHIRKNRRVSYSQGLSRKFPGGRIPITESGLRRERAFLVAFGLSDRSELRTLLGRRWGYLVHKKLPKALCLNAPAEIFLPEDLAARILALCKRDNYFRSRLEPLLFNLVGVAAARPRV